MFKAEIASTKFKLRIKKILLVIKVPYFEIWNDLVIIIKKVIYLPNLGRRFK